MLKSLAAEDLGLHGLNLLTSHPVLYVCNVSEEDAATGNAYTEAVAKMAEPNRAPKASSFPPPSNPRWRSCPTRKPANSSRALGLDEAGLDRLIRAGYQLLDLITYFTVGPKETRAWTIERGTKAPAAAGVIHTDFERGFIRAFTIAYDDYVALGGEVPAKEAGKARDEGKEYVVQDGDVLHFRFNT
jgi:ribosome-binding ATPase YchF (GTP1/OBG family)